jgi:hypothetical protein
MTQESDENKKDSGKYISFSHDFFDAFSEKDVNISIRFAKPGAPAAERAQKQMMKSPGMALRNLCGGAVHPDDKAKMTQAFNDFPGLASTFGGALLKACGFGDLGN